MNNSQFIVLVHGLHFLFLIGFGGFRIPIVGIPCENITNLIHLNYFDNIIMFSISEKTLCVYANEV
jgi:hypothetical protein